MAIAMRELIDQRERSPRPAAIRDPKEVVAVVLADGSVRELRGSDPDADKTEARKGTISGPDWILWWERRSFTD